MNENTSNNLIHSVLRVFDAPSVMGLGRGEMPDNFLLVHSSCKNLYEIGTAFLVKVPMQFIPTIKVLMDGRPYKLNLDIQEQKLYAIPLDDWYTPADLSCAHPILQFTEDDMQSVVNWIDDYEIDVEPVYPQDEEPDSD